MYFLTKLVWRGTLSYIQHPLNRVLQRALLPTFIRHRYRSLNPVLYRTQPIKPHSTHVLRATRMTLSVQTTTMARPQSQLAAESGTIEITRARALNRAQGGSPPSNSALGVAAMTSKRPSQASAKTTPERPRMYHDCESKCFELMKV